MPSRCSRQLEPSALRAPLKACQRHLSQSASYGRRLKRSQSRGGPGLARGRTRAPRALRGPAERFRNRATTAGTMQSVQPRLIAVFVRQGCLCTSRAAPDGNPYSMLLSRRSRGATDVQRWPAGSWYLCNKGHRQRQQRQRMKAGKDWREGGFVFTVTRRAVGRQLATPLHPRNVLRTLHELLRAADLPRVRFHDLRHSAASHRCWRRACSSPRSQSCWDTLSCVSRQTFTATCNARPQPGRPSGWT